MGEWWRPCLPPTLNSPPPSPPDVSSLTEGLGCTHTHTLHTHTFTHTHIHTHSHTHTDGGSAKVFTLLILSADLTIKCVPYIAHI